MSNPTDLTNVAELGITSGTVWGLRYTDLTVKDLDQADYLAFYQNFKANCIASKTLQTSRKLLTNQLKNANLSVGTSLSKFKKLIDGNYMGNDLAKEYAQYGIEHINGKYSFPSDNDNKLKAIGFLVVKLSEPGNILAKHPNFGLAFWSKLQTEYATAWANAKDIDGRISTLVQQVNADKVIALKNQKRLRLQIQVNYPDSYKSVLRDFGFQKEKY